MKTRIALLNGRIYSGGAGKDSGGAAADCQAVLIEGDRIREPGTTAGIQAAAGADAVKVDLGGRRVIPGFVDSHNHVLSGAVLLSGVNCFGLSSIAEVKETVANKAAELGPGEWVTGAGWIESQFSEGRMPTRQDLDEAAPRNPVILSRLFGMSWVNSLALEMAGIGKGYVPQTGRVDLDGQGEPTGILREGASGVVRKLASERRPGRRAAIGQQENTERMVRLALGEYLKHGITSVLDPGVNVGLMRAYTSLRAKGQLPVRVTAMPAWHGISVIVGDYTVLPAIEAGMQPGIGDEWFRLGGLKMAIDGGLGSKTALMHGPWRDFTRSTVPYRLDLNRLGAYVRDAHDAGWGVGIHCCGDLAQDIAISHMVDAYAGRRPLPHPRHHIIHGYYPTEYALRAMAEHDIPVSVQPGFIYVEGDIYPTVIDESRLPAYKPLRTYLDRGIRLAVNSDVASGPYDPFVVLYGAVARRSIRGLDFGQAEALTAREAVSAFCAGGAYLAYRDHECGTISPGKLADLAILDQDILDGPPDDLLRCEVDATVLGGRFVYLREDAGLNVPAEG